MYPRSFQHYFYADGTQTRPSIPPTVGFSPNSDAERIQEALRYAGTNEKLIISILGRRTSLEREKIAESFKMMFKEDMGKRLNEDLSLDFRVLVKELLRTPWTVMAETLFHAMKGPGTREKDLVQVLASCSNSEATLVKAAYSQLLIKEKVNDPAKTDKQRTLEDDIKGDTSGYFKETLLLMIDGHQDEITDLQLKHMRNEGSARNMVNEDAARIDCKELYDAGEGQLGTKDRKLLRIIVNRSVWHLKRVFELYQENHKNDIVSAIKSETSFDFKDGLLWLVEYTLRRPSYYAELIHSTMKGLGTKDRQLMRLIILRADIDLEDIKDAYLAKYEKTLEDDIRSDTSGDYRKLLLALAGCKWE